MNKICNTNGVLCMACDCEHILPVFTLHEFAAVAGKITSLIISVTVNLQKFNFWPMLQQKEEKNAAWWT